MTVSPGFTILLHKPNQSISHPWVVITEPIGDPAEVLMVNLTSYKERYSDPTVILTEHDHPFLDHQTVVRYSDARWTEPEQLIMGVERMGFERLEDCSPEVVERIRKGLIQSPETSNTLKEFGKQHFSSIYSELDTGESST